MSKNKKYSREQLIKIMKKRYEEYPNTNVHDFVTKNNLPSWSCYQTEFGSFSKALEICNINNIVYSKNITKEEIILDIKELYNKNKKVPKLVEILKYTKYSRSNLVYYFGKENLYENIIKECGIYKNKQEFLISEIQRFVKEFDRVPIQKDFENLKGYPSRKTFTNHFDTFNEAIVKAGFTPMTNSIMSKSERLIYNEEIKEDMINFLKNFNNKYGHVPTCKELEEGDYKYTRANFRTIFGSYTDAVKIAGLKPNSILKYDDEFLHNEFERFIKENGRTPYLHEFNNSEYPSFWCYQKRFGSWNKTFIAYGYEPNDSSRKYYLEDGEVCCSSYEFDISKWLKENNIKYDRDVKYRYIDKFGYKGKMDCDYKIYYNNKIWYVEMAGYLPRKDYPYEKWDDSAKKYKFKLNYKEKLLKRNNLNYLIITPHHMKTKTLEEIFKDILN